MRCTRFVLAAAFVATTGTALPAQGAPPLRGAGAAGPPAVTLVPAAQLRAVADSLAAARTLARDLGGDRAFDYIVIRRDTTGAPEVHARWSDVVIAQTGRATVLAGGRADGARETEPGEWRGGRIVSGGRPIARHAVGPGDVLVVPAGVPHQVLVAPGEAFTYLVVKAAAPPAAPRRAAPGAR